MADPLIVHGDIEALVVKILKDFTPELAGYNVDKISTDLRGYKEGQRWIVVTQEGSSKAQWNVINKPRIDIEVRGDRRTPTKDMAEIAEGSIFRSVGVAGFGAKITQVKEEMGLTRVPDKEEIASYRYIFSVRLVTMVDPDSAIPLL